MKLTGLLLLLLIVSTVAFGSPVSIAQPPSIIHSITQFLSSHFGPTLQETLQQLTYFVFHLAETVFGSSAGRSGLVPTAPWVSDMFGGLNSISLQWNQHITDFFTNIPTEFVTNGRALLMSVPSIKEKLDGAVKKLLIELQQLFLNEIHRLCLSLINKYHLIDASGHFERLFNDFHEQISLVFDQSREQLNLTVDQSIQSVVAFWSDVKDHIFG
jgi:hypothetical protein